MEVSLADRLGPEKVKSIINNTSEIHQEICTHCGRVTVLDVVETRPRKLQRPGHTEIRYMLSDVCDIHGALNKRSELFRTPFAANAALLIGQFK